MPIYDDSHQSEDLQRIEKAIQSIDFPGSRRGGLQQEMTRNQISLSCQAIFCRDG